MFDRLMLTENFGRKLWLDKMFKRSNRVAKGLFRSSQYISNILTLDRRVVAGIVELQDLEAELQPLGDKVPHLLQRPGLRLLQ